MHKCVFHLFKTKLKNMQSRLATTHDIHNVLTLQKQNLFANLSEIEREDGFVTTPFTYAQIREIINQKGLFVTENESEIIAYAFAGSKYPKYFSIWSNLYPQKF